MLNPDWLRRKSAEASARLQRQREEEEALRRREEEARRLEEERQRQLQAERERVAKIVEIECVEFLRHAIAAASQGARSAKVEVDEDLVEQVVTNLRGWGYAAKATGESVWRRRTWKLISNLTSRISSAWGAQSYVIRLTECMKAENSGALIELVERLQTDKNVTLDASAEALIKLHLMPHLKSGEDSEKVCCVLGRWDAVDLSQYTVSELRHVPFWLSGASGGGLFAQMGARYREDAESGHSRSEFQCLKLPSNPGRWGLNEMVKLSHRGEPIGVFPLPMPTLVAAIECLGFKARVVKGADLGTLTVSW